MLTKNIDVTDGLVNSAAGTVTGFIPSPDERTMEPFMPKYILVHFQDERVGRNTRQQSQGILPP